MEYIGPSFFAFLELSLYTCIYLYLKGRTNGR